MPFTRSRLPDPALELWRARSVVLSRRLAALAYALAILLQRQPGGPEDEPGDREERGPDA